MSAKSTSVLDAEVGDLSHSGNCARIMDLGYIAGKRMNLYGEHLEIVSDPFADGDCVAVRAISGNDPTIRTIQLPVSILVCLTDAFPKHAVDLSSNRRLAQTTKSLAINHGRQEGVSLS
jgi:hypothetical protein